MNYLSSIYLIVLIVFCSSVIQAQDKFNPEVLVLTPDSTSAEEPLQNIIIERNKVLEEKSSTGTKASSSRKGENFEIMAEKKKQFNKHLDFYNEIAAFSSNYLKYALFSRFKKLLVYAVNESSGGTKSNLKRKAKKHEMRYVFNLLSVHSYMEEGEKKSDITIQLYDHQKQAILLEKTFTGNDENPGGTFSCENGSLQCTINNAMSKGLG